MVQLTAWIMWLKVTAEIVLTSNWMPEVAIFARSAPLYPNLIYPDPRSPGKKSWERPRIHLMLSNLIYPDTLDLDNFARNWDLQVDCN